MFKMEINRVLSRPVFWLLLSVGFIIAIIPVIQYWPHGVTEDYYMTYPRSAYVSWMYLSGLSNLYNIYTLIFPLLAALAYSDTYAEDFNTGYIKSILTKVKKKKFLPARFIVNFCVGGCLAVFPLLINFLGEMAAFPLIDNNYYFGMVLIDQNSFLPSLFYHHPILYILMRLVLLFFLGGLLSSLGLALSTLVKNRYVVLVFPFIVFMGLDIIFNSLGYIKYSIYNIFLENAKANWGIILYLFIGISIVYIWFRIAGERSETL